MTSQGLTAAGLIVTRVAMSISLVVLLTLTTPWNRLLAALRGHGGAADVHPRAGHGLPLRLPPPELGDRHVHGPRARTVGADTDAASGRRFVAATAGALFGKSHALAEEVHMAMVSRGYTGDVRTLSPPASGLAT